MTQESIGVNYSFFFILFFLIYQIIISYFRPVTPFLGGSDDGLGYKFPSEPHGKMSGPYEQLSRPSSVQSVTRIDVDPLYSKTPANERDNSLI